jgi:hypothetical protein
LPSAAWDIIKAALRAHKAQNCKPSNLLIKPATLRLARCMRRVFRHGVKESQLGWNGTFKEDSSKGVSTVLLLSCMIKRCLQTHALCAPSRFVDLMQRAKCLQLDRGDHTFLQSSSIKHNEKGQNWVVSSAGFDIAHGLLCQCKARD